MSSQALPAQQYSFHYLFEKRPLGIALEDLEGKLVRANPHFCSCGDKRDKELCGLVVPNFVIPKDFPKRLGALLQHLLPGSRQVLAETLVRKDGISALGTLGMDLGWRNGMGGSPSSSPLWRTSPSANEPKRHFARARTFSLGSLRPKEDRRY